MSAAKVSRSKSQNLLRRVVSKLGLVNKPLARVQDTGDDIIMVREDVMPDSACASPESLGRAFFLTPKDKKVASPLLPVNEVYDRSSSTMQHLLHDHPIEYSALIMACDELGLVTDLVECLDLPKDNVPVVENDVLFRFQPLVQLVDNIIDHYQIFVRQSVHAIADDGLTTENLVHLFLAAFHKAMATAHQDGLLYTAIIAAQDAFDLPYHTEQGALHRAMIVQMMHVIQQCINIYRLLNVVQHVEIGYDLLNNQIATTSNNNLAKALHFYGDMVGCAVRATYGLATKTIESSNHLPHQLVMLMQQPINVSSINDAAVVHMDHTAGINSPFFFQKADASAALFSDVCSATLTRKIQPITSLLALLDEGAFKVTVDFVSSLVVPLMHHGFTAESPSAGL